MRYFGDGSGRDSYVVKDSGGMIPGYRDMSPDKLFYGSLRQHRRISSVFVQKLPESE